MNNFAYFGTPYVARDTLEALVACGYIPSVVITSPDALRGRGMTLTACETKVWAQEHHIPVLSPSKLDADFIQTLSFFSCDYGIAVAYGKIIPQAVLNFFPKGMMNVHYSLLPKYRGASPVEMALWNGDMVTGVSLQKMVFELDAGDVLAQKEESIHESDTALTLRPRLIRLGADMLCELLPAFIAGTYDAMPQDTSTVTRAPKIKKEQGELTVGSHDERNWNTYRALRESPGTYFYAEKEGKKIRVKISSAEYTNSTFRILRIIPEGKSEQDFSWLSTVGYVPVT